MRVLTVRQPWAWAIFHGKDVENRSNWRYTYTGPLVIHAGLQNAPADAWHDCGHLTADPLPAFGRPPAHPVEAAFGALIGIADLAEPHWWRDCLDRGAMCSRWAQRDQWHLPLSNQLPLLEPIEAHGQVGLWSPPKGTRDAALAARRESSRR